MIAFRGSEPIGIEAEPRYSEYRLMASELGINYQDATSAVHHSSQGNLFASLA